MKKILHISKYYYPFSGGIEHIARDCVLALEGRCEQRVIAFNDGKADSEEVIDGVKVLKCGCCAKISAQSLSKTYGKNLKRIMREFDPDVVIFHYPNPFVASFLLRELKHSHAKLIVYWHLDIIRQRFLRLFFIQQNKNLLKKADKVIATSPRYIEGSKWLQSVRDKCIVIANCINVEMMQITPEIQRRANEIRTINRGKTICLAVGRHTEYKGFKFLIRASQLLDDNFVIYIAGSGELTGELHKQAAKDHKIVFTGRLNEIDLKALLLAADIFCFPSITKNEAFGLALAEAMYYEKPAVTFTIPGSGVNYVCINGEDGIEVENRNIQKYAQALQELSEDEELRSQYGKAGRKRVEEHFLSTQFFDSILKIVS